MAQLPRKLRPHFEARLRHVAMVLGKDNRLATIIAGLRGLQQAGYGAEFAFGVSEDKFRFWLHVGIQLPDMTIINPCDEVHDSGLQPIYYLDPSIVREQLSNPDDANLVGILIDFQTHCDDLIQNMPPEIETHILMQSKSITQMILALEQ